MRSAFLPALMLRARRAPRSLLGPALLAPTAVALVESWPRTERPAVAALALAALATLRALRHGAEPGERGTRWDLEAGVGVVLCGAYAAAWLPPPFALAALQVLVLVVATVARGAAAPASVVAAVALAWVTPPPGATPIAAASTVGLFGALASSVTRVELLRARAAALRTLADDRRRAWEDARLFRLVSATEAGGRAAPRDDERMLRAGVEQAHHGLFHTLELVHRSLDLHSCILFLLDPAHDELEVAERVSSASAEEVPGDTLAGGPRRFPATQGVFGAVVRDGRTVRLDRLRDDFRGLPWVEGPCPVRSFVGVPVVERGVVRGVLCADRATPGRPFGPRDEELLARAAEQLLRVLTNERVFVQLDRSRHEQAILHRASQALGAALDADAVIDVAFAAAKEIVDHDLRAWTAWDPGARRHRVGRAEGVGADRLDGVSFGAGPSLVSMVVNNRHPLPYRADYDPAQQILFSRRADPRELRSALVLPLQARETVLGTLVLAARRRRAFGDGSRATLEALANQTAVALANAAAVRRLEDLATTDGLTGCLNKRAFLEALDGRLRAATRFERPVSLIVTDIDHFKSVNDTYGHATGDVVIRELGAMLRGVKRDTDLVARFGGEEFCVLCEQTDAEGARLLAERIRSELEGRVFSTAMGDLRVTCSLGVATFPTHGTEPAALFEAADQALYRAKGTGRNRVSVAETLAIPARAG